MESVYIETTIISYLVSRPSRDVLVAARQHTTFEWWNTRRMEFACYISQVVVDEISLGDREAAARRVEMVKEMPMLEIDEEAEALAAVMIESGILPETAARDAAHIAVSTVNGIDYLLTWNCRHLANAQIARRVRKLCESEGYEIPVICTPEELMGR